MDILEEIVSYKKDKILIHVHDALKGHERVLVGRIQHIEDQKRFSIHDENTLFSYHIQNGMIYYEGKANRPRLVRPANNCEICDGLSIKNMRFVKE